MGVTSARAESGRRCWSSAGLRGGHLRACGERALRRAATSRATGSPPRVRRAGRPAALAGVECVGHLRACGERAAVSGSKHGLVGSPPRVRRADGPVDKPTEFRGVTSARAESGRSLRLRQVHAWGHLRACGERRLCTPAEIARLGSPPRVRRAVHRHIPRHQLGGVTSARAESGLPAPTLSSVSGGHLRACGERLSPTIRVSWGSPPRVRRAVLDTATNGMGPGVTSARAESGHQAVADPLRVRGHLSACGERRPARSGSTPGRGSPPRVRRAADILE